MERKLCCNIRQHTIRTSPFREVNHEINLVDPDKQINYRLPKCPEHHRSELSEKIQRYTTAKWWVPVTARQAVPMLCIPKKNGKLHTVFNLCEQNNNTVKDVMPFPDQDNIRHDVTRCPYWSKLNMSEVYENMHKTDWHPQNGICHHIGDVCQSGDAARWLQCPINLSKVDDCNLLRLHR